MTIFFLPLLICNIMRRIRAEKEDHWRWRVKAASNDRFIWGKKKGHVITMKSKKVRKSVPIWRNTIFPQSICASIWMHFIWNHCCKKNTTCPQGRCQNTSSSHLFQAQGKSQTLTPVKCLALKAIMTMFTQDTQKIDD